MRRLTRRELLAACTAMSFGASFRLVARGGADAPAAWQLGPFRREHGGAAILEPSEASTFDCPLRRERVRWEAKDVFNPAAVVRGGAIHLLYRAQDRVGHPSGTSRIGLATSTDGIRFDRRPTPVLYPADDAMRVYEWEGGCEDPRVVESDDGRYVMTYTAYDGTTARLAVATSRDLVSWTKHGLAFASERFRDVWSKSGAIVCALDGDRLVATRLDGSYWMYWGDTDLFLARSHDLVSWEPVEASSRLVSALRPRSHRFDSALVEAGPPPIVTPSGIRLLYNGANRRAVGDPRFPDMAYSSGQVLFDPLDPGAVVERAIEPFLVATQPGEQVGQVGNVVFIESLVPFRERWWLYYGMGDSRIGVASAAM